MQGCGGAREPRPTRTYPLAARLSGERVAQFPGKDGNLVAGGLGIGAEVGRPQEPCFKSSRICVICGVLTASTRGFEVTTQRLGRGRPARGVCGASAGVGMIVGMTSRM